MIIKEEKYNKALEMFNNLKQYIGKEVKVIYYIQDKIEYYVSTLEVVNDFDSIVLNGIPLLEFFSDAGMIYEICFGGEILYRNPNGDKVYFDSKERVFGISDGVMKLYNQNRKWALDNKGNEKYVVEMKGVNLVDKDKQTEWLSFVEYFYDRYDDSDMMNLVINILDWIKGRVSYEAIYNNLINDKVEFYEKEIAVVLDIISYFTDNGKFLKEYLQSKFNSQGLNLTLNR